jgi:hypothetical protein
MSKDPVAWLAREVTDLLDAGSVGLYEFIWLLRDTFPTMTEGELRAHAAEALELLQQGGAGRLVWLRWPAEDVVESAPLVVPSASAWGDPSDGKPYLALSRN